MKTAKDFLKQDSEIIQVILAGKVSIDVALHFIETKMIQYAKEAIKQDRKNIFEHATMKSNIDTENDRFNYSIDKDSIINAPQIELK